ncbi:MAG: hypothetical protein JWL80_422 [Parcubacteria group bacterium]|nr:hypothetical protein [Parcubacteria group bacterium]
MTTQKLQQLAPTVLRIGLALVFIWFGSQQLNSALNWTSYIPQSLIDITGFSSLTFVYFNGAFEVVFGLALLTGFFTRITALLLALHMFDIMYVVGYNEIGIRDFGLAVATLAIFLYGVDNYSLDRKFRK